jgi:hypothetical protein
MGFSAYQSRRRGRRGGRTSTNTNTNTGTGTSTRTRTGH